MARYAIGDIQGCLPALKGLLAELCFDSDTDELWLVGDLIARGDDSLATLRYLYKRRHAIRMVLGNHDLHLLAHRAGTAPSRPKADLQRILDAPDCDRLCDWLQQQPLLIADPGDDIAMAHAGIPPQWNFREAALRAREVEHALQGERAGKFFASMYGDTPALWRDDLSGKARLRCITNHFTRMRCMTRDCTLDLKFTGARNDIPRGLYPWFELPGSRKRSRSVVFGHWAALGGVFDDTIYIGLDTGCVWGGYLSAVDLDSRELTQYRCR